MSLSLKHIPCPAGTTCTAFQCIFGHAQDRQAQHAPQAQRSSRERSPPDQSAPQKRIKTNQHETSPRPRPVSRSEDTDEHLDEARTTREAPPSRKRTVSPPPIRRDAKAARGTKSSGATSQQASSSTPKPDPKPNGTPPVAEARKPKSLNPRLLKSPPASHETRLKLLKMLHAELSRLNGELKAQTKETGGDEEAAALLLSDQDLICRALDGEQTAALEKPAVYSNVMKNKVLRYRRMKVSQWKDERVREAPASGDTPNAVDGGPGAKEIDTGLTSAQEVTLLRRLLTDVTGLSHHGYVSSIPSEEAVAAALRGLDAAKGWERCDRCQQRFQVFPGRREEDGALTSGGPCRFHWGKAYVPAKAPGDHAGRVPRRYLCCGQEVGESAGCFTHDNHVFKAGDPKRLAAVLRHAATPPNADVPDDRAVCFDCEMAYTVHGMELVRLTATAWPTGEELLDVLVQPLGEILDLNSRYSGVWPEDMARATEWTSGPRTAQDKNAHGGGSGPAARPLKRVSSPQAARDLFFSLLSPSTPLIGHGLENDLNAVRVVHPTLVDTVLLYPHKAGLPYRQSLKMLMDVHLNKKIQVEAGPKASGHDSAEDARAAGELVRLKVMNVWKDLQRAGWRVVDGEIWPPGKPAAEGK